MHRMVLLPLGRVLLRTMRDSLQNLQLLIVSFVFLVGNHNYFRSFYACIVIKPGSGIDPIKRSGLGFYGSIRVDSGQPGKSFILHVYF